MNLKLSALLLFFGLLLSDAALAEDAPSQDDTIARGEEQASYERGLKDVFKFSGFGTLSAVGSDNDRADFVNYAFQPNGAGYTRDWSTTVDSRIGVQLTYLPTDKFSAVVQVIAEQEWDNSWNPDLEWAFLQYNFTPNFSLRAGRIILPNYMFSEYRKVGYALPWVRPPVEFYGVPVNTTDGIGLLYKKHIGELNYTFYSTYGEDDSTFPGDFRSKAREAITFTNTFEYHNTSFRLAYSRVKVTLPEIDDLTAGWRVFGPEGEAIYDKFKLRDREFSLLALGGWHDPGKWFVGGEWSRHFSETGIHPGDSWYLTGGYRLGKFTPYLTYAQTRRSYGTIPQLSGPPGFIDPFNEILNLIYRPIRQSTVTVGTRWDFAENAAFKVQLDHIKTENNTSSLFTNVQPNFDPGDSVNLLSFSLDFVF